MNEIEKKQTKKSEKQNEKNCVDCIHWRKYDYIHCGCSCNFNKDSFEPRKLEK